jgi:hypothetical protein
MKNNPLPRLEGRSVRTALLPLFDTEPIGAGATPQWSSVLPPNCTDAVSALTKPTAYVGLYGFHKYWGKKPVEPLRFLLEELTCPGDLVVDPFVGSGAIGRETVQAGRKFVGGDVNPIAVKLTKFFLSPSCAASFLDAYQQLEERLHLLIDDTYRCEDGAIASHVLWESEAVSSIWIRSGKRRRIERLPTEFDTNAALKWGAYCPRILRPIKLFDNSRINTKAGFDWNTLFSGRALRNVELLLEHIRSFEEPVRTALEVTLTASVGQMSNMVFAITSRGKTTGATASRTEVGSWVIGYWRPNVHFETNVWNCFESKANKLLAALRGIDGGSCASLSSVESVVLGRNTAAVEKCPANVLLEQLPDNSAQLLITDPPHGDRIPYLELSEMWNGVLNESSVFEDEIVVSNARQRAKTVEVYSAALNEVFALAARKLRNGGVLVLMFNSKRKDDWRAIRGLASGAVLNFIGRFPLAYSATSVVQDNRDGSMKTDYILLFTKGSGLHYTEMLASRGIPGWSVDFPVVNEG